MLEVIIAALLLVIALLLLQIAFPGSLATLVKGVGLLIFLGTLLFVGVFLWSTWPSLSQQEKVLIGLGWAFALAAGAFQLVSIVHEKITGGYAKRDAAETLKFVLTCGFAWLPAALVIDRLFKPLVEDETGELLALSLILAIGLNGFIWWAKRYWDDREIRRVVS